MNNTSIKESDYLENLKKEVKELEKKYSDIMLERKELEQKLHVFKLEYNAVISPYYLKRMLIDVEIMKILREKNKKFEDIDDSVANGYRPSEVSSEDVKEKEEYYNEQKEEKEKIEKNEEKMSLEDKGFLKKLYKKLVMMFHPDRFAGQEEKQAAANEIMKQINAAYTEQDLEKLKEIEKKGFDVDLEEELDETKLLAKKEQLLEDIRMVNISIDEIKESGIYKLYSKYLSMGYDSFYGEVIVEIKEDIKNAELLLKHLKKEFNEGK